MRQIISIHGKPWPRALTLHRAVLAGIFLGLVNLAHAQILTDGGFESGLNSWRSHLSGGGAATFASAKSGVHSGTNALLVKIILRGKSSFFHELGQCVRVRSKSPKDYVRRLRLQAQSGIFPTVILT